MQIAENFNKMFVNVASRLNINNTPEFSDDKLHYFVTSILAPDTEAFYIPPITEKDIQDSINKLPPNKATGYDGMSARILKTIAPALISPLKKLLNFSIENRVFPNRWRTAQVSSLYKSGQKDDVNNYRPIAVLPVLSKILERHVAKSLTHYLNDSNLIYKHQSAFRENHSTETALVKLID